MSILDPWLRMHTDDWNYFYECVLCPVEEQGVVLDVRARGRETAPVVKCPFCERPMLFKGRWRDDAGKMGEEVGGF